MFLMATYDQEVKRREELQFKFERVRMYQEHLARVKNARSVVQSHPPALKRSETAANKELDYIQMMASMSNVPPNRRKMLTFSKTPVSLPRERFSTSNLSYRPAAPRCAPVCGCHHHACGCGGNWDYVYAAQQGYSGLPCRQPRCRSALSRSHLQRGAGDSVSEYMELVNRAANSHYESQRNANKAEEMRDTKCSIPQHVIHRYEHLTSNRQMLRRLLRPRIYMDLEVQGLRPLGRLTIQLYTEACPEVVLEFVRICSEQARHRIAFTRFFPPMWCEAKIELSEQRKLCIPAIEHDENVLDHGSSSGILSFPSRYVRGSKCSFLTFSLSFKPLKVLNGRRIAFGRVRRGLRILEVLQEMGHTRNGRAHRDIVVTKCGMWPN